MISSPLTLLDHYPENVRLDAAAPGVEITEACTLQVKNSWTHHIEDNRRFRVESLVRFGKTKKGKTAEPYRGEIRMVGLFQVHAEYPEDRVEALIGVTAASMLYGACRELICNLTARHPHGCLTIPSVSFVDAAKPTKTAKKKGRKSTKN